MPKKIDFRVKCDFCNKPAAYKLQKMWIRWIHTNSGEYKKPKLLFEADEPTGENNLHLCEKHYKAWHEDVTMEKHEI